MNLFVLTIMFARNTQIFMFGNLSSSRQFEEESTAVLCSSRSKWCQEASWGFLIPGSQWQVLQPPYSLKAAIWSAPWPLGEENSCYFMLTSESLKLQFDILLESALMQIDKYIPKPQRKSGLALLRTQEKKWFKNILWGKVSPWRTWFYHRNKPWS